MNIKKYLTISICIVTLFVTSIISYNVYFNKPLVSVILLTYNRADMLPRAIDSILAQTYKNWELIIINDGSTDGTSKVMNEYALKDKRIKTFENDGNKKIVYGRNRGLSEAKGKYIAWIDDDDKVEPNKLEQQVAFMEKHKDITILGTDISLMNGEGKVYLGAVEYTPEEAEIVFLLGRLPVILATTMWRHDFIKEHDIKFNSEISVSEDLVIYDEVLKHGGKMVTLPEALYKYRVHHSNPKEYYRKIGILQKTFYKTRWNRFYPDVEYPKTQCERLKYIQKNNNHFNQSIVDSMVKKHCKTHIFIPSAFPYFIPFEDGEEAVVVSIQDRSFYSYKMKKHGRIYKIMAPYVDILWAGEKEPTRYYRNLSKNDN